MLDGAGGVVEERSSYSGFPAQLAAAGLGGSKMASVEEKAGDGRNVGLVLDHGL